MNAVNLYTLTRDVDGEIKSLYEKALLQRFVCRGRVNGLPKDYFSRELKWIV